VGRAIAAYRRAEELAPRDADIRANLDFARGQVRRWCAARPFRAQTIWTRCRPDSPSTKWTKIASLFAGIFLPDIDSAAIWPACKKSTAYL